MGYGKKDNEIGQWSIDKLLFLKRYLPLYAKATKKAIHRYYIDGFAGRGEWIHKITKERVEGSALLSLNLADEFTHLFYIDLDAQRTKDIEKIISEKDCKNATVYTGDCNIEIFNCMEKINKRAPTFVFLDPSGDHLKWSTIEHLSKWRTELFILYPYQMTLRRYLPRNMDQKDWMIEKLNDFFGTDEWKNIYLNQPRNYLAYSLLKLYTDRLQQLGYEHVNISDCFKVEAGPDLYYMIWVGKHKAGKAIMDYVYDLQSPQLKLF